MDVAVLGHIVIETIVFPDNRGVSPVLGSPAAYSTVILSRLGDHIGLCTKVGPDFPRDFIKVFKEVGVNLAGMSIVGKYSTRNRLIYSTSEKKHVEYLRKAPKIEFSDLPENYRDAKIYYVCPMDYEIETQTVKDLKKPGKKVIVDLGGYGGATSATYPHEEESPPEITKQIIRNCDIVKASLEDCQYIFGNPDSSDFENHYVDLMLEAGAKDILITMREKGVFYANLEHHRKFFPLKCKAVDTTGAGDAFAAGMIHNYLKTKDICAAVGFGQATACYVIERTGGVIPERMPTEGEVLSKIRETLKVR